MEVAGPLGTPLGLAQRKRASPRGEAAFSELSVRGLSLSLYHLGTLSALQPLDCLLAHLAPQLPVALPGRKEVTETEAQSPMLGSGGWVMWHGPGPFSPFVSGPGHH